MPSWSWASRPARHRHGPRSGAMDCGWRPRSMDGDALHALDACALGERYDRQQLTPVDVIDALLARIERLNPLLNAFITVTAQTARAEARQAARELQHGKRRGRLHGIPVAIKDVIHTRG